MSSPGLVHWACAKTHQRIILFSHTDLCPDYKSYGRFSWDHIKLRPALISERQEVCWLFILGYWLKVVQACFFYTWYSSWVTQTHFQRCHITHPSWTTEKDHLLMQCLISRTTFCEQGTTIKAALTEIVTFYIATYIRVKRLFGRAGLDLVRRELIVVVC